MAVITITEAAKRWKVGRATIYRKLDAGELSGSDLPDGGRGVDTSELQRVFGLIRFTDALTDDLRQAADAVKVTADEVLRRENEHLRALLEVKNEHIESLKQAMRLLEHRPAVDQDQAEQPKERLTLWRLLKAPLW